MVDPNPARGMPLQLQKYWLVGKGAAKIRWHMPHDFDRCVRNLRKYFPKNPEGLCNILHQKAVGAPPGKGHGEHSLTASMTELGTDMSSLVAAQQLIDKQPALGQYTWAGPLAPIGRPTGEPNRTRVFEDGALYHRTLPLPFDWRERTGPGHMGSVTVGRILGITYGPDHMGQDYCWGWGDFLDEAIFPAAKQARHLAEGGVAGPSLDPGGPLAMTINPETGFEHMTKFGIGGATLVSIPAFASLRPMVFDGDGDWPEDDDDGNQIWELSEDEDCGCSGLTAAVNSSGWRGLPLAPREAVFDNDDAVKRIAAWAQGGQDVNKMRQAFMWYDPSLPPTDPTSYRLPVGDVINGRLTLIYHAIYAAAALLSGAHGGLPQVPEPQVDQLRNVISDIYPVMAKEFNDSSIRAPWDRSAQPGVQMSATFAAEPYGDVKYADPGYRDNKKRYPIDTEKHIRAAWAYINQGDNAAEYTDEQLAAIKAKIMAAAKKQGIEIGAMTASMNYPVYPPKAWFQDPQLQGKTRTTVTPEGQVYGHLAIWNECHRDFTSRGQCVMPPRSEHEYAQFHLGTVVTAEQEEIQAGKIIMNTRHAGINLGYAAAAVHYDDTGDEIAVIRCGEDAYGIWFAGAVVPEATPAQVAKLRRSPLSGDWRREQGALELTAALAVNAPAFPVYAIQDDEQTALVAGMTWDEPFVPPTGIIAQMQDYVDSVFAQSHGEEGDRGERLSDILEDADILAQRERARRLSQFQFAVNVDEPAVQQGGGTDPAAGQVVTEPGQEGAPSPAGGESATDAAGMDAEAWQIAAENSARYVIVKPGIGNLNAQQQQQPSYMQGQAVAPAPAAPAPAAPAAPQPTE